MDSTPEEIAAILKWLPKTGVTGVLTTVATCAFEEQVQIIESIQAARNTSPKGTTILGIHLEGPYINKEKRGAQPMQGIRLPDLDEMKGLVELGSDLIRQVTIAPELPGALEVIEFLSNQGAVVSAGHSNATYEQIRKAEQTGLSKVTHSFNSMSAFHHRKPGVMGAVFASDTLSVNVIFDGLLLHAGTVLAIIKAAGLDRVLLVTDATQAAGLKDGIRPGNRKIIVKDNSARLENGRLAGSVLTLNRAVKNVAKLPRLSLEEAVRLASAVPARILGFSEQKGEISSRQDADLVLMDDNCEVKMTLVRGKTAFTVDS